ncbi:ead/Ea22-like family protein [Escherichia coli]|uniref:ead/Ea22-like family protein n=1 Tax=Escherichia coli TaxID=562 RepID=UPI0035A2DBCE
MASMTIDYQALRDAAEAIKIAATPQKLLAFRMKVTPQVVLALLDERERNQQYIKSRDQENEDIALTVGRLLIENGQLVADTLRHLADNEIDSDYFAITSTNENGTEIDHEMAITDYALQAAGTVDELVAALESAEKRIAELKAEPVSQAYNLPELIEGMEVSIDVSTCDADLGNRYFGTVTEALELDTAKNGYILLVQDAEPNFDINGNSPVTPDGWVIVPKKLTAENGAKGVLSGEFSETTFISCPECFGDDDCETCDGSGRIEIKVPVSWTTIKTIWAKGCEYFSIVAPQQDG